MPKDIILIDYENIHVNDLLSIAGGDVLIKVFYGKTQKFSGEFLKSVKQYNDKIDPIEITGAGKNALDFHIAYYMGLMAKEAENANARFCIVSKDTGFTPLVNHVNSLGKNRCIQVKSIGEIVIAEKGVSGDVDWYKEVVTLLNKNKKARPKKIERLKHLIKNFLHNKPSEKEVVEIVDKLIKDAIIQCNSDTIIYK